MVVHFGFYVSVAESLLFYKGRKINHEEENLHHSNRNHFHKSALSDYRKNNKEGCDNQERNGGEKAEMLVLFNVCNKEQYNGCKGEYDEDSCCNPMGNSLRIPVGNTVAESESDSAHTKKAENTKSVKKFVPVIVLSVHKLSVENNASRGENAPKPEEDFSVLTKK